MTTTTRPPAHQVPPGYTAEPRPAGPEWRLAQTGKLCAQKRGHGTCRRPAVLELNRRQHRTTPRVLVADAWWPYCDEHTYGRWIEDGQVLQWITVPSEAVGG